MNQESDYYRKIDKSIKVSVRDAWEMIVDNPALALFAWRTLRRQNRAEAVRSKWGRQGIHVPPFMIASITNRCNLRCRGCYAHSQQRAPAGELEGEELFDLIGQAAELGISMVFLAGGEPLLRRDELLRMSQTFPQIIFLLFTNGLLMDDPLLDQLRRHRNLIPIVSLEGDEAETDIRRGDGVYSQLREAFRKMKKEGILCGVSLTVTRDNFSTLTGDRFIRDSLALGAKIFFFVEYVPVKEGTEDSVLTQDQRTELLSSVSRFRAAYPGLFIAFPGDEEKFGGCLAAGRGFVHVSPEGDLEPCPFAPYSDTSLRKLSLKEALQSDFLAAIRREHRLLGETSGGCALWMKRDVVAALLQGSRERDPANP